MTEFTICKQCDGSGQLPLDRFEDRFERCPHCNGTGVLPVEQASEDELPLQCNVASQEDYLP
jgi:DnaJ-class molecular chaperone